MTIHLPNELESSIRSFVQAGRFSSEDELVAEAVRAFLRRQVPTPSLPPPGELGPDPVLGSMRDYADEMDEIVADAYRLRAEEHWRVIDVE